jgi:hypothetical protein
MKNTADDHPEVESPEAAIDLRQYREKALALRVEFLSGLMRSSLQTAGRSSLRSMRKPGLFAAVIALATAGFWLTTPTAPLGDAAPFSMNSIVRETPPNLPTLSADTF